jgi:hypothetical protein
MFVGRRGRLSLGFACRCGGEEKELPLRFIWPDATLRFIWLDVRDLILVVVLD